VNWQGTVTLASVRPVAKADALYVLENALRMSGVALVRDRGGYRLLPANEAGPGGVDRTASAEAGQGISVVPLRYVSAQTVFKLLDAFGVKATSLRPDNGRNTLIVSGNGSDRAAAIDTILSFDADWMRGQSVGSRKTPSSSAICSITSNAPVRSKTSEPGMLRASICTNSTSDGRRFRAKASPDGCSSEPTRRSQRRDWAMA
jgi:type II secretory pathway component GspD/PulD (secretin)